MTKIIEVVKIDKSIRFKVNFGTALAPDFHSFLYDINSFDEKILKEDINKTKTIKANEAALETTFNTLKTQYENTEVK